MRKVYFFFSLVIFSASPILFAEQIELKSGTILQGEVVDESKDLIKIKTEELGVLSVKKKYIVVDQEKTKLWSVTASSGCTITKGNTDSSQVYLDFKANRKTSHNEFIVGGNTLYSSSNKKMDAQKSQGMVRYAYSFGSGKWYNFYKLQLNHDRFADIDLRAIASGGLGYWFSDKDEFKAMTEVALGHEHTEFRSIPESSRDTLLIWRSFLSKQVFSNSTISQDISLFPTLDDFNIYRVYSETAFINPVSKRLSLKLALINEYDSHPAANIENRDLRFIGALLYNF